MKINFLNKAKTLALFSFVLLATLVSSCKKGEPIINLPLSGPNQEFFVLANNNLLKFNANNIKSAISQVAIAGIIAPEKLLSIDFRPATGELYAVSDASKLYIIDAATGKARLVSTTAFTPALDGTVVSLDFNPAVDKIRIVTNTGQNIRINPETGQVVSVDTKVGNTAINGVAYDNNIVGATSTTLYDIDVAAKVLYKQDPPNNGALVKVGNLELDLGSNVSFDISADNKNAIAIGRSSEGANLYTINLGTGLAKLVGRFPTSLVIQGIAMPVNPVAYAISADKLMVFDFKTSKVTPKTTTGLQTGETVLGMDMRPANGQLYALGSNSRLYTLDAGTATFTLVGALSTVLAGTSFGFDFEPVNDVIKIVSNTGQNLSVAPATAIVTLGAAITPATATVSAAAYNNNFKGANTSVLYVIDHTDNKLYTQNGGAITAVGELKIKIESSNGFDIISTSTTSTAYGFFTVEGKNGLYKIDLTNGLATLQYKDLEFAVSAFTLGLRF